MFHYIEHDDAVMAYFKLAQERWAALGQQDVARMAHLGAIFRYVAALNWACKSLRLSRLERALKHIPTYTARLHDLNSQSG